MGQHVTDVFPHVDARISGEFCHRLGQRLLWKRAIESGGSCLAAYSLNVTRQLCMKRGTANDLCPGEVHAEMKTLKCRQARGEETKKAPLLVCTLLWRGRI